MQSILVKIGKVQKVVQKNGIFGGIKIVFFYVMNYLKSLLVLASGDVLIITDGTGDSAHFRARNQAEEFNLHGISSRVSVSDNPWLTSLADKFKIFVFHRTFYSPKIQRMIEKIKSQNKEIIFDTDDLVFDRELFHQTEAYQNMNNLEKKQYANGIGSELVTDPYIKTCSVSTEYLAQKLRSIGKKVFISPNKISSEEEKQTEEILKIKKSAEFITIGYFSGSYGHNRDFSVVAEVLKSILEKYKKAKLLMVGYLNIGDEFSRFGERVEKIKFVPRKDFWHLLSRVDINLAPSVIGDPFSEAKSELKFFEAGILAIPVVAARNKTFSGAIIDGENGFLAVSAEEWEEKIARLIQDEKLRRDMGEKARAKALEDYTVEKSHNEEYYGYLREKLKR